MRAGAPGRRGGRVMGALPLWRNNDDRWLALEALERDALAASTREAMEAKLRTIRRALAGWGLEPLPPSMWTVRALGATLKRGGYRSAASYLWLYKAEVQRMGVFLARLPPPRAEGCDQELRAGDPPPLALSLSRSLGSAPSPREGRHG